MKFLLALGLFALSLPAAAQTVATVDTQGRTPAGVQYVQPKDWSAVTAGKALAFVAPEGDLKLTVVAVGAAADARAAAEAAWRVVRPAAVPSPRLVTAAAPGEGWDERAGLGYETAPSERAVRSALALRKGTDWTVLVVDGAAGTAAKRSAALAVVQAGLHPAGYAKESFAGRTAHRLTPDRIQALRDFVAQSAQQLGVPGVGLALIDQGKVVWQGGVGVRALGSPERVDADTKFMIASNTKGMATLLLSVLADEGKLRWDQPVVDVYPGFKLGSDATTRATQVRHLVCACTGLPRKDYSFILADPGAPASDTFRQLAVTQPTSAFGELFQYNNLMASAAGYLGGSLAYPGMELGAAFDKAMQSRIFGPLGMTDTGFDFANGEAGNWAPPHGLDIDGRMVRMTNDFNHTVYPHRPAGGAFSTASDMARYVQLELTKGLNRDGKRVVSEANLLERRKRGVQVSDDSWYGMGLFERSAWGIPVVTHGGTLLGYHSNWYALPDTGVGAVILTNADPGAAMLAPFLRRLLEVMYDGQPEAAGDVTAAAARINAQAKARRDRVTYPGDPAVLASLAARYRDAEVGSITISERNGAKWIKAGFVEGPIATRTNADGSTSIVSVGAGAIGVDAQVGTANGARTLTISDGQQHQYVYVEQR
ncbi:serine hydrolase domain-containing protein [Sandarakinorhabdus sp. DWP1-3-1]|uniref:serine hydrolase domain-containing protein n=1 Tax=Sandarakinorhabdus sp. DWP1-3-1 TaxID=2804627 RepID=UPI003CFAA7AB